MLTSTGREDVASVFGEGGGHALVRCQSADAGSRGDAWGNPAAGAEAQTRRAPRLAGRFPRNAELGPVVRGPGGRGREGQGRLPADGQVRLVRRGRQGTR